MAGFQFERGAVVLMDAMGFRGLYKDHSPAEVIKKLELIREHAMRIHRRSSFPNSQGLNLRIGFFSDSVYVCASDTKDDRAVLVAAIVAGYLIGGGSVDRDQGVDHGVQLAYRGAVAFGDFYVDDKNSVLVGPAVDEAAENSERACGAFVVLHGEASRLFDDGEWGHVAVPWDVPVDAGRATVRAPVVSPFPHTTDEQETLDLILRSFERTPTPRVAWYRANTAAFLEHAMAVWRANQRYTPAPRTANV